MSRRRKAQLPPNRARPKRSGEAEDLPSLLELERFTQSNLRQWRSVSAALDALHSVLHFGLEPLRQRDEQKLLDAIRSRAKQSFDFNDWSRIVDYRYSLAP